MELHPSLKKWLARKKCGKLNDIQESCLINFDTNTNILIQASTASGKTEAAFLPALNEILWQGKGLIICVCPLRALISDLKARIDDMLSIENEREESVSVICWHSEGDGWGQKKKLSVTSSCVVIITPESLEALVRKKEASLTDSAMNPFSNFDRISTLILDEFHVLLDSYRGIQLKGVLCRLQSVNGPRIDKIIGLSATLSSKDLAIKYFSCLNEDPVFQIEGQKKSNLNLEIIDNDDLNNVFKKICAHNRVLIFPNTKKSVEEWASDLTAYTQKNKLLHKVLCHHASLSSTVKSETIEDIRKMPYSITVCTSTLELGIDLPNVDLVVQVGLAPSAQALRQRAGRSGRGLGGVPKLLMLKNERNGLADHESLKNLDVEKVLLEVQAYMAKSSLFEQDFLLPAESVFAFQTAAKLLNEKILHKKADFFLLNEIAYPEVAEISLDRIIDHWITKKIIQEKDAKIIAGNELATLLSGNDSFTVFEADNSLRVEDLNGKYLADAAKKGYKKGDLFLINGRYWEIYSQKHGLINVKPSNRVSAETVYELTKSEFKISQRMSNLIFDLLSGQTATDMLSPSAKMMLKQFPTKSLSSRCWTTYEGSRINQALADVYSYITGKPVKAYLFGIYSSHINLLDKSLMQKAVFTLSTSLNYVIVASCEGSSTKWSQKLLPKDLQAIEHSKCSRDYAGAKMLLEQTLYSLTAV